MPPAFASNVQDPVIRAVALRLCTRRLEDHCPEKIRERRNEIITTRRQNEVQQQPLSCVYSPIVIRIGARVSHDMAMVPMEHKPLGRDRRIARVMLRLIVSIQNMHMHSR